MPTSGSKKLPAVVVEKARALAGLSKQYTIAASTPKPVPAEKRTREKVVAALKRLHPMD